MARREPGVRDAAVGLVGNPHARSGHRLDDARRALIDAGARPTDHLVEEPARIGEAIEAAIDEGCRRIVVAGGDGTVTTAIQALVHSDVELAILPMGTQNNFARSVGIPTDLEAAAALAARGRAAPIDVGCADGTYFANAVTIGLSSHIARQTPRGLKRLLGQVAFGIVGIRVLATARPFTCILATQHDERTVRTFQVVVANGRRIGQAVAAPGATADDGMLDVTTLGDGTRRSLVAAWWAFQRARHADRDDTVLLRTRSVHVATSPAQRIDIDGEVAQRTPTSFWVEPGALQVVVP